MSSVNLTCLECSSVNRVPTDKPLAEAKCGVCGSNLAKGKPLETDLATLEKAGKNDELPLVLDLWAPWCGPCTVMAPEFAKVAEEMTTKARFAKINTDHYPDAAVRFNIRGIPTMILFYKGQEIARHSGAMRAPDIKKWIQVQTAMADA